MRILIVKTSSMGDVVHAAPLVTDIHQHFPQAQIDWLVEESFAAIPRLHPAVTQVIPVAVRRWRKALLERPTWREMRSTRAQLQAAQYDHVIDCQGLLKSAWLTRWARRAHTVVAGPNRASAREGLAANFYDRKVAVARNLHAIERNRRIGATALGYALQGAPCFGLQVRSVETAHPTAVLLTNASRATKLWPDAHWRVVEQALAARGLRSVLFWGGGAEEIATQRRAQGMAQASVAGRCGLQDVAAALAGAAVVVGLDTGLTHLAAALGVPTVGIFCDYDPALVGITGDAPCESLGGVSGGPAPAQVVAAIERVMVDSNFS